MKTFPGIVRIFAADDVRDEIGGKHTVVGIYGGDDIIFQTPPGTPDGARPMLSNLAIYSIFSAGVGEFNVRFELEAPSKVMVHSSTPRPIPMMDGKNMILIFKMANVAFPEDGTYCARVFLDDRPYELKLRVGSTAQIVTSKATKPEAALARKN